MALITCKECGKSISDSAAACPHCGSPVPAQGYVGGCLTMLILAAGLIFIASHFQDDSPPPKQARTAARIAADAKREAAFQKVAGALTIIKKANRSPASVVWEAVMANDDASAICIQFRGQNGFGGMTREQVAFIHGAPTKKVSDWNAPARENS